MYLCDIGNSNVDFYHDGKVWSLSLSEFQKYTTKERVYYISVNESVNEWIGSRKNFIDLEPYFNFDTIYQGLGIDRIAACSAIKDGMVVDAGSAITVDIMANGLHLGGFILPGLMAYQECYKRISPRLDVTINPNVALDALPQKTKDAISYGIMKPILMILQENCKDKHIFFTGGDGQFFSRFFSHSIYDKTLIFRGMQKVIEASRLEDQGFKD